MSVPVICRSSDTGAPPVLTGTPGDLVNLLDKCLVTGYGAKASGTLTWDAASNPADGDAVTIGTRVYTLKAALTGAANEVLIGATGDASLTNLAAAINGAAGAGSLYGTGTAAHGRVGSSAMAAHAITVTALLTGTTDNGLATTETSAHLSWAAAALAGGTGQPPAAWTKPYSQAGTPKFIQASVAVTGAAVSTVSATQPTAINVGDLLLMTVWIYDGAAGGTTVTTPAGWTALVTNGRFGRGPTLESLYVFYKVATSTVTTAVTLTSSGNCSWQTVTTRYGGCDPASPVGVEADAVSAAGLAVATPSVTTTGPNRLLVSIAAISNTSLTLTLPAGFAADNGANGMSYVAGADQLAIADKAQPVAGASGAFSWGLSANNGNSNYGVTISLKGVAASQAVFRPPAGKRFFLQVDDSGVGAGAGRDAQLTGFETMSGYGAGTGMFPPNTGTANAWARKSATSSDAAARPWMLVADDRTVHLFVQTGDSAGTYVWSIEAGDFFSLLVGDAFNFYVEGHSNVSAAAAATTSPGGQIIGLGTAAATLGKFLARAFSQLGGWTAHSKMGDQGAAASAAAADIKGAIAFPNGPDGGLYLSPLYINEAVAGTQNLSTSAAPRRGAARGVYQICHALTNFADGETFPGAAGSDFDGRAFVIVSPVMGATAAGGFVAVETTAWDSSA